MQVGEVVNLKSVASEPEIITIGIVSSRDPSKKVGGGKLSFFFVKLLYKFLLSLSNN